MMEGLRGRTEATNTEDTKEERAMQYYFLLPLLLYYAQSFVVDCACWAVRDRVKRDGVKAGSHCLQR